MIRCVKLEALHIQKSPLIMILITYTMGFYETDLRKKYISGTKSSVTPIAGIPFGKKQPNILPSV